MIKDTLNNYKNYINISENIAKGFNWLISTNLDTISDGKYIIDGENVFANVQTYNTKEDALFEAHRNYIDIQYMINGTECIGVAQYSKCKTVEKYVPERDIEFLSSNDSWKETLGDGDFLVFFPNDAHQPSLIYKKQAKVKKVVVKVKFLL